MLLRTLHGGPGVAPSRLAERLGMTRGGVTKLADRLVARELVERRPNADDARGQTPALTAAGVALTAALAELAGADDAEFFGHLDPEARQR